MNESQLRYFIPTFFMKSNVLSPSHGRERNLFKKFQKARIPSQAVVRMEAEGNKRGSKGATQACPVHWRS